MSDQELFSEDFSVRNSSPESGTEYDSDGGSPRARPAFSVGNFFSKRQRCDPNIATGGGSIVQQQQQEGVGIVDKRRRRSGMLCNVLLLTDAHPLIQCLSKLHLLQCPQLGVLMITS